MTGRYVCSHPRIVPEIGGKGKGAHCQRIMWPRPSGGP
ncbi:hypothetical protein I552_4130 [Mycobacterium xenopi 3993]|nr:hypothetical protein I552_4130 [Mycobacterium xenopi 3993]